MAKAKGVKAAVRKGRLPRIVPSGEKRKRTMVLTASTWQRLGAEADRRGVDRSQIAELILDRELNHVQIRFAGGEDGEAEAAA